MTFVPLCGYSPVLLLQHLVIEVGDPIAASVLGNIERLVGGADEIFLAAGIDGIVGNTDGGGDVSDTRKKFGSFRW